MANRKHLAILKRGVKAWNKWRAANIDRVANLNGARLSRRNLSGADLRWADLSNARLDRANLTRANLNGAKLIRANLNGANLSLAYFDEANLYEAKLQHANLKNASLSRATLTAADLRHACLKQTNFLQTSLNRASLSGADLSHSALLFADLSGAGLREADFTNAQVGWSTFGRVDLSTVKGLETLEHFGPSTIGIDTMYLSQGKIPEMFLRDAGVQDNLIVYMNSLVEVPCEFYSCFISYSSKDQEFATRLHADLQSKGVRCWFAPEDLKIGEKLRSSFDEAIRIHDKLMVILSKSSVTSPWVEKEVETACETERQQNRTALFPIRLDDAVMETHEAWAADMRRARHIGDFRDWKNHDSYKKAFDRLLRDLRAEEKSASAAKSGI